MPAYEVTDDPASRSVPHARNTLHPHHLWAGLPCSFPVSAHLICCISRRNDSIDLSICTHILTSSNANPTHQASASAILLPHPRPRCSSPSCKNPWAALQLFSLRTASALRLSQSARCTDWPPTCSTIRPWCSTVCPPHSPSRSAS
jgi:hypothetical protein